MFVVLEIQTTESTMSVTPWKFDSLAEAKQKYHSVLAFAAVSSVPIHTAMIPEVTLVTAMVPGIVGLTCWKSRQVTSASMPVPMAVRSHAILMRSDC